ncbi:hypothetical protein LY76DRAFT_379229 [Colletotrichum caudatum]|nr:hypothetical protein LY76DRAFT_379229 [Colletotrichum caudatum]
MNAMVAAGSPTRHSAAFHSTMYIAAILSHGVIRNQGSMGTTRSDGQTNRERPLFSLHPHGVRAPFPTTGSSCNQSSLAAGAMTHPSSDRIACTLSQRECKNLSHGGIDQPTNGFPVTGTGAMDVS